MKKVFQVFGFQMVSNEGAVAFLPIEKFDSEQEAIDYVNANPVETGKYQNGISWTKIQKKAGNGHHYLEDTELQVISALVTK